MPETEFQNFYCRLLLFGKSLKNKRSEIRYSTLRQNLKIYLPHSQTYMAVKTEDIKTECHFCKNTFVVIFHLHSSTFHLQVSEKVVQQTKIF